ncbi:adenylyl-sulfate kinase [Hydrogenophilus thiooxidans]|uniref:adenylyl-sulfate kinase n=1 Tax=Hydrogenophilus thiooxidans TaxID=2820326 RepID=UPI003D29FA2D
MTPNLGQSRAQPAERQFDSVTTAPAWWHAQHEQDLLRFLTCGSVDDGKSTLMGRLLYETGAIYADQLAALTAESQRFGTTGGGLDFALLFDGLSAEREQGITIDVAYRYFATPRRKFIVADSPGHEQYTRNMVTAASQAEAAVILVDARKGILTQTKRHARLVALMGIRHVALAINKMDTVAYAEARYRELAQTFTAFAATLGLTEVTAIPVSALAGDNVATRSSKMAWYRGPTLLGWLETVPTAATHTPGRNLPATGAVVPVQWVARPHSDFRGYAGPLIAGRLSVGDRLLVARTRLTAEVCECYGAGKPIAGALAAPQPVLLRLSHELDISRGDLLLSPNWLAPEGPVQVTDQIAATLIWLDAKEAGLVGRQYAIKIGSQWGSAILTAIKGRRNVDTGAEEATKTLAMNDIAEVTLSFSAPLALTPFETFPALGGFILVDRFTNATVAAGLVRHSLRRAENLHPHAHTINRAARERLNGHRAQVVWLTGLSGAGKSTIADLLERQLYAQGVRTYLLDGDNLRTGLNRDLGFTDADRVENIRRAAEVAKLMTDAGLVVIVALISPFCAERQMAREIIGAERFLEVFIDAPLEVCESRDPKGLYRKARAGLIPNMTGIQSPYEPPQAPDLRIDTSQMAPDAAAQAILAKLIPTISAHSEQTPP